MITVHHPWVFAVGLVGNAISFMVFLAPVPTFIRVYKKKSTEGFQSLPYVVAIFSAMLWIYYALLKRNDVLLITINAAGVVIETVYIAIFITYAPKRSKISTLRLLLLLNFGGFCTIVLLCHYLFKGGARLQVFGWICVAFSISVFAAPLSIIRLVIRTKSVEYMPFNLSFCLTLTATIWFMYGMLQKDLYITLPNVVGFMFGVAQMVLYGIYRKHDEVAKKQKLPEKQVEVEIPVKEIINDVNSITSKNEDMIMPPQQQLQEMDIEIVIRNKYIESEDNNHREENFHGPLQAQPCNVDVQKSIGGGSSPAAVQLVQCAV